jgi:tRNA-2-methylthio-N6-dimethylallyladenosine synthase
MPTFVVETYGCQMNVHDSERIAGLLLDAGYTQALADTHPDLVVFNTCAVRENADNKLYGMYGAKGSRCHYQTSTLC